MYIERIPNRNSPPAILVRESWREEGQVRKRTLANLSKLPEEAIEAVRRTLQGDRLVSLDELFSVERSLPHGHVEAVLGMIRRLGLDRMISARRCRERDLVVGMIAARLLHPGSKLATTRQWTDTTLAESLGVQDAEVDELYEALKWLGQRQPSMEKKLAKRHLHESEKVLYDVTSSYYEGRKCPLIRFGYSRDHRGDRPQIVYGLMTDSRGCPVSVEVYPGNVGDPKTVPDQVEKLRDRFGLERVVLVGDRGMLTQTQIHALKDHPGIGWISALRSVGIKKLLRQGAIEKSLLDESNLAEIVSPDYPGERLIVCYNPLLAEERKRTRNELLSETEKDLEGLKKQVARRTRKILSESEISFRVGQIIGRRKMRKHFLLSMSDGHFQYERNEKSIREEESLDGIYIIRTSESQDRLSSEEAVRSYKSLSEVERAFRCLKGLDLRIRPIFHHREDSVRAHVFLCMLAYYVEWHLRKALAPLLFDDENREQERKRRHPVGPAKPSDSAARKKQERINSDGLPIHSFQTLLAALGTRCKNLCRLLTHPDAEPVERITQPTPLQEKVLELIEAYPVT